MGIDPALDTESHEPVPDILHKGRGEEQGQWDVGVVVVCELQLLRQCGLECVDGWGCFCGKEDLDLKTKHKAPLALASRGVYFQFGINPHNALATKKKAGVEARLEQLTLWLNGCSWMHFVCSCLGELNE